MATKAAQFKALATGTELNLPSGFTVLARRVDVRVMLKTGRIPNSLRPILDRAMQGQETPTEDLTKGVLEDPTRLDEMFGFIDQMWIDCVIDPPSAPDPRPAVMDDAGNVIKEAEFDDPEIVYPKDVPDADKMFVMNWAMGGSSDLERFREESASDVQRVHDVARSWSPPEPSIASGGPVWVLPDRRVRHGLGILRQRRATQDHAQEGQGSGQDARGSLEGPPVRNRAGQEVRQSDSH